MLQGVGVILAGECQDDERQDAGGEDSTMNSCQDATTRGHLLSVGMFPSVLISD